MLRVLQRLGRISDKEYLTDAGIQNFYAHDFLFQIDPTKWSRTINLDDAQIVPFIMNDSTNAYKSVVKVRDDQVAVNLLTYDIDYTYSEDFLLGIVSSCNQFAKNNILVHTNENLKDHPDKRLLYHDAMYNIVKLYSTEFDRISNPQEKIWTLRSKKIMYRLPEIKKTKRKKFITMAYVHELWHPRNRYRHALGEILKEFGNDGYIGDSAYRMLPNEPCEEVKRRVYDQGGNWYPVADTYYFNTYLSIFVETVTQTFNSVRSITEKTYDQIGRGNFILPFAYPGIIEDLMRRGFKFPDWIKYRYDSELDNDQRFLYYISEVKRLVSKPIEELHDLYLKDREILIHNQNVFHTLPYCNLYEKLKERIDVLI
jgi:hypothetical protein